MSIPVADLEAEVLGLPPQDRARLLERLLASFEPPTPAQAAWMDVAQRRQEAVRDGSVSLVPAQDALARVRARLA